MCVRACLYGCLFLFHIVATTLAFIFTYFPLYGSSFYFPFDTFTSLFIAVQFLMHVFFCSLTLFESSCCFSCLNEFDWKLRLTLYTNTNCNSMSLIAWFKFWLIDWLWITHTRSGFIWIWIYWFLFKYMTWAAICTNILQMLEKNSFALTHVFSFFQQMRVNCFVRSLFWGHFSVFFFLLLQSKWQSSPCHMQFVMIRSSTFFRRLAHIWRIVSDKIDNIPRIHSMNMGLE